MRPRRGRYRISVAPVNVPSSDRNAAKLKSPEARESDGKFIKTRPTIAATIFRIGSSLHGAANNGFPRLKFLNPWKAHFQGNTRLDLIIHGSARRLYRANSTGVRSCPTILVVTSLSFVCAPMSCTRFD